mgnify:CR=1 FL=1
MSAVPQTAKPSAQLGPLDDIVLRRPQPLSSLPAGDPELNLVYEYWNGCRNDGLLPRRKDIDVLQLKPLVLCGCGKIYHPSCPQCGEKQLARAEMDRALERRVHALGQAVIAADALRTAGSGRIEARPDVEV